MSAKLTMYNPCHPCCECVIIFRLHVTWSENSCMCGQDAGSFLFDGGSLAIQIYDSDDNPMLPDVEGMDGMFMFGRFSSDFGVDDEDAYILSFNGPPGKYHLVIRGFDEGETCTNNPVPSWVDTTLVETFVDIGGLPQLYTKEVDLGNLDCVEIKTQDDIDNLQVIEVQVDQVPCWLWNDNWQMYMKPETPITLNVMFADTTAGDLVTGEPGAEGFGCSYKRVITPRAVTVTLDYHGNQYCGSWAGSGPQHPNTITKEPDGSALPCDIKGIWFLGGDARYRNPNLTYTTWPGPNIFLWNVCEGPVEVDQDPPCSGPVELWYSGISSTIDFSVQPYRFIYFVSGLGPIPFNILPAYSITADMGLHPVFTRQGDGFNIKWGQNVPPHVVADIAIDCGTDPSTFIAKGIYYIEANYAP